MGHMIRVSEAANLGLHAMLLLAADPARPLTAREGAAALGVSENHLIKVLQRLARAGLASARRGPRGGFVLGRRGRRVRLLEVYEAVAGPLQPPSCLLPRRVCRGECALLGGVAVRAAADLRRRLAGIRLAHVATALRPARARTRSARMAERIGKGRRRRS